LLLSNRQQSILQPFLESCLLVDNFVPYGLPLMLVARLVLEGSDVLFTCKIQHALW